MSSVRVKDKDRGFRKLLESARIGKPVVSAGIFAKDAKEDHGDGATVLDVAIWNEFGVPEKNIPARSFIRAWGDENRDQMQQVATRLLRKVIKGQLTKEQALEQFGLWMQGGIQRRMAQGIPPPNAASTIAKKGSSKPLIDAGVLRSSVTFAVDGKIRESKAALRRKKQREKARAKARKERVRSLKKTLRRAQTGTKKVFRNLKKATKKLAKRAKRAVRSKRRR